jgi:hypothetical protein
MDNGRWKCSQKETALESLVISFFSTAFTSSDYLMKIIALDEFFVDSGPDKKAFGKAKELCLSGKLLLNGTGGWEG